MASAATAPAAKPTLESLVTRFRREAARDGPGAPALELEVRFQGVDYANFAAIYRALAARGPGAVSQMVSAIVDGSARGRDRGRAEDRHAPRPMRIRVIHFAGGRRDREEFVRKTPLVAPYRVPNAAGLAYTVALSAEQADAQGFSSDADAVLRAKARVSFRLALPGAADPAAPPLEWRVDLTATRQILGADAGAALPQIVGQMFRTAEPMSGENFLRVLRLDDDAEPAARHVYRYEVEVEFVGAPASRDAVRPADVTAAAGAVLALANPEAGREAARQAVVYRVAQLTIEAPGLRRQFEHQLGLKRLLPQARAITRADYREIFPPVGFFLTDKADGRRAVAVVREGRGVVVADTLLDFAPRPAAAAARLSPDTVVDGELVLRPGGEPAFHAFDVIAVLGEVVARDGFEKRVAQLGAAVDVLREAGIPAEAKAYVRVASGAPADLRRDFLAVLDAPRPYATDGLILVAPGAGYADTVSSKWKPAEHNTIDALARRAPGSVLGRLPFVDRPGHKLHFLFVGASPDFSARLGLRTCPGYAELFGGGPRRGNAGGEGAAAGAPAGAPAGAYFPIQFAPADAPFAYLYQHPDDSPFGEVDGRVVEVVCAGACAAAGGGTALADWRVVRVREDRARELLSGRYFGNDYHSAEVIWLNYLDPFPREQLWEGPSADYFLRPKADAHRAQTAVVSFAKTRLAERVRHVERLVDFAAGKGQDMNRFAAAGVRHYFAVDKDRAALAELTRRRLEGAKKRPAPGRRDDRARTAMTVHVLAADLSEPHAATLAKLEAAGLPRSGADAGVCNLAVHYFLGAMESLRNFVALARGAVKIGGHFLLTAFVGEAVHAAFVAERVPEGGTWDVVEADVKKFSLKRLYSSDRLEAVGQRIGVLLPFSDGQYYEEYLVNTEVLAAEFRARGFRLLERALVSEYLPDFEARNRAVAALLTPGDRRYLALYGTFVFRRDS